MPSLDEKPGAWSELLQPVVKAALVVGVDSSAGAVLAAVGVGVINVGMTLVAMRLLDRAGRRTLLMVGVSGMTISLFTLGLAFVGGGASTFDSALAPGWGRWRTGCSTSSSRSPSCC